MVVLVLYRAGAESVDLFLCWLLVSALNGLYDAALLTV